MSINTLRAAILVVSTTVANDPSTDACESTLKAVFDKAPGSWNVVDTKIVSDKKEDIQDAVKAWCEKIGDESLHLIVTSGGTGFSVADITPEVRLQANASVLTLLANMLFKGSFIVA